MAHMLGMVEKLRHVSRGPWRSGLRPGTFEYSPKGPRV